MATSSITKDIIIDDPERFLDAIMQSAKKQGIDIDADIGKVADIVECFGAHERLYKQQKEKTAEDRRKSPKWPDYDYIDDINDIFPWIPRGEFKRVKE